MDKKNIRARYKEKEQRDHVLISYVFELLFRIVSASVWISFAYFGSQAIASLAGKETTADFLVQWLTSPEQSGSSVTIWIIVALLCTGWALVERRLRQRKTASLSNRIKTLERELDEKRTSSGLTVEGKTPPRLRLHVGDHND